MLHFSINLDLSIHRMHLESVATDRERDRERHAAVLAVSRISQSERLIRHDARFVPIFLACTLAMALGFFGGLLQQAPNLFNILTRRTKRLSIHVPPTLNTLPTDVLHLILERLYDPWVPFAERRTIRFDHETSKGRFLLPLSECSRHLREQTRPWLFREVYNWDHPDGSIWPDTLWPFFRILHIRDRSIRQPANITLFPAMYKALPMMVSLTKVTLHLDAPIPADLLHALSLCPQLLSLEIHQARFDRATQYYPMPFSALQSITLSISGFRGVVRRDNINRATETRNVVTLLKALSHSLTALQISGDLLGVGFLSIIWQRLRTFTVTEHTPTPYIPVPDLVSQMLLLEEMLILYSADLSRDRDAGGLYPPFTLGTVGGELLTRRSPLLKSATLSNLEPADPIFAQLPCALPSLHLRAMVDNFVPDPNGPVHLWKAPLTNTTAVVALQRMSHLGNLTELSLELDNFVMPSLIHHIAAIFPQLRSLGLGHASYLNNHSGQLRADVRDVSTVTEKPTVILIIYLVEPAILDALQAFPLLTHLRISLDFMERQCDQETPQHRAAYWLFDGLPHLQLVAFSWEQEWFYHGFDTVVWREWDRRVLQLPPFLPSTPSLDIQAEPIPPWELDR
ncbi:hypothetical protein B0H12DRAFT_1147496 [Mycena haematopus]|nr:hypothetical protein B0H12DRAFT_1147496 [Mycena haematopus]